MKRLLVCILSLMFPLLCAIAQPDTNASTAQVSLQNSHLTDQVRKDILAAIAKDFFDQPKDQPTGRTIALGSWVTFIRLSQTDAAAILIEAGPDDPNNGSMGNSEMWLFKRVANHATLILKAGGGRLTSIQGAYHHKMLDVETQWNYGGDNQQVEVYHFDGVGYKSVYCYPIIFEDDGKEKEGPHGKCEN